MMSLVLICGPAIGGLLVAAFGFRIAFLVNALSFLGSAWLVSDLDEVHTERKPHEGAWHEILGGVRVVRASANLRFLFVMYAVFSLVIGIQFPLIYVFVAQNLHGGPQEIGWLFSAIGIGGIIGGAWLASLSKEKQPFNADTTRGKQAIAALIALDGVVVVSFADMHHLLPVAALYTLFGFIGTSLHASLSAAIASQSPENMRGRVFALYSALSGPLIVLSIAVGTPFARDYGATVIFYISGSGEVLLAALAAIAAARFGRRTHHARSALVA
jgi:MFS family permease